MAHVHGVAPELAALVVLADGLAVRAARDVRDVLDLVLVLVTPLGAGWGEAKREEARRREAGRREARRKEARNVAYRSHEVLCSFLCKNA